MDELSIALYPTLSKHHRKRRQNEDNSWTMRRRAIKCRLEDSPWLLLLSSYSIDGYLCKNLHNIKPVKILTKMAEELLAVNGLAERVKDTLLWVQGVTHASASVPKSV